VNPTRHPLLRLAVGTVLELRQLLTALQLAEEPVEEGGPPADHAATQEHIDVVDLNAYQIASLPALLDQGD
jgi:hypothetical protein